MATAYICGAVRTPFGRRGGQLRHLPLDELAARPLAELVRCNPRIAWEQLQDVVIAGTGNDATPLGHRAAAIAGIRPAKSIPHLLKQRSNCGLGALVSATAAIESGTLDFLIAGGAGSASQSAQDGPAAGYDQPGRGHTTRDAEHMAKLLEITRDRQDAFALRSRYRWSQAHADGFFERESVPLQVESPGLSPRCRRDEGFVSQVGLPQPCGHRAFDPRGKTLAPDHSSFAADGACALLLASGNRAKALGLIPRVRILGTAKSSGGAGPAASAVLAAARLRTKRLDVIEINESFAACSLAALGPLDMSDDDERLNPNGGALSIGSPTGASGARLVITALNQLDRLQARYALCAMEHPEQGGLAVLLETVR